MTGDYPFFDGETTHYAWHGEGSPDEAGIIMPKEWDALPISERDRLWAKCMPSPSLPEERYCSASQVEKYELCPRKWAFRYVDGIEDEKSDAAELGTECHEQLELWLRDGRQIDLTKRSGKIVVVGLHLLPSPGTPGLVTERELLFEMGGHKWIGYTDYSILGANPRPIVGDHKTTGDFRWMKSAEKLRTSDGQAALYAAEAMLETGADAVDLQWNYFRTKGAPKAEPVRAIVTRDDVTPTLTRMIVVADEMQEIRRQGLTALQVVSNPNACDAFGGCPHKSKCNISISQRFKANMAQQKTAADVLAELKAKKTQGVNAPPAAVAAGTTVAPVATRGPGRPSNASKLAAAQATGALGGSLTASQKLALAQAEVAAEEAAAAAAAAEIARIEAETAACHAPGVDADGDVDIRVKLATGFRQFAALAATLAALCEEG